MACDTPFFVKNPRFAIPGEPAEVPVPCGKCPPCKQRRVNSWVFRLLQEEKRSTSAHFVTLTYDTTQVPISNKGFMTLKKKDVQDFFKRLRKREDQTSYAIKYYIVGEYGTNNWRPHYHAIIFNIKDLDNIAKAWTAGSVHMGQVTGASIAYTCKYIAKPGRVPLHKNDDRLPEFSLMSKGLGDNYLSAPVKAYHKADLSRNYVTQPGGEKLALPRFYREKIYTPNEKVLQRRVIQIAMDERKVIHREQFERLYPGGNYDAYCENERHGRFVKYYHKDNQTRNL